VLSQQTPWLRQGNIASGATIHRDLSLRHRDFFQEDKQSGKTLYNNVAPNIPYVHFERWLQADIKS
jgi:hypothetical protein